MLLDTHVLVWLLADPDRLGPTTTAQLQGAPRVLVSAASTWELAIKSSLGKIDLPADLPARVEEAGLGWLPVAPGHAWEVQQSTVAHADPFDRLLVAQAVAGRMPLVTADRRLLASTVEGLVTLDART